MSLAATPIIPESAKNYSLLDNVANALSRATEVTYPVSGSPTTEVHPLLLMHHFLHGMPQAGEGARELTSALGKGATESPLFDKIFQVPLPIHEQEFKFEEFATSSEILSTLGKNDQLAYPYKTDIIVFDYADRGTLKVTRWHQDDPRGENPHNHPWADKDGVSFVSYIVRGGYTETVTSLKGSTEVREYRAGDRNVSRYDEFHTVSDILPGTLTILMCAPRAVVNLDAGEKPWGYIVFEDEAGNKLDQAELVDMSDPRVKDTSFLSRGAVLNPGLRFIYKKS